MQGAIILDEGPQAEPDGAPARGRLRLVLPMALAAGWGALLTFAGLVLFDDFGAETRAAQHRESVANGDESGEDLLRPMGLAAPARRWRDPDETGARAEAPRRIAMAAVGNDASFPPQPPVEAAPPPVAPAAATPLSSPAAEYVGTWGPAAAACGAPSRRRGYIPATISQDGAQAGRTLCRFRSGHREGPTWAMTAECSERGRRWTSQVRLLVEGDRLVWTSAKGTTAYIRCGRRNG
ncbi:hypothetical protein [Methylobacterium organophilum]|uniref:Peptidase inhibitor family I36 protein n=1 Tax=Methylobacterium organophilum TaxID=410 RepID=A0ABQ4T159_METOR|nr:hypothetical protein [Methylobacterium organophilum]GJE25362.1 hypothetical protein LKMONMHP_0197 [Methylobacterium organophilum]